LASGVGLGAALLVPGLGGGVGAGLLRAGSHPHGQHGSADGRGAQPVPAAEGLPLVEPEVRRSAGGELTTTLRVRYAYQDVGGARLYVRTYDGMIPGPTLRARPGDLLKIRLVNDLPPNRDHHPSDPDLPHQFNTTNLHT